MTSREELIEKANLIITMVDPFLAGGREIIAQSITNLVVEDCAKIAEHALLHYAERIDAELLDEMSATIAGRIRALLPSTAQNTNEPKQTPNNPDLDLDALIKRARAHKMTLRERLAQCISFARGLMPHNYSRAEVDAAIEHLPETADLRELDALHAELDRLRKLTGSPTVGCICPPGANRDCQRADCPRKGLGEAK